MIQSRFDLEGSRFAIPLSCYQICTAIATSERKVRLFRSRFKGLNVRDSVAKHSASTVVLDNQSALHISRRKSLVET